MKNWGNSRELQNMRLSEQRPMAEAVYDGKAKKIKMRHKQKSKADTAKQHLVAAQNGSKFRKGERAG